MSRHYCWNCNHFSDLPDGWHCAYCLRFFYANSRLPLRSDPVPATDSLSAVYTAMGWTL